jgi:hypothetical protein
MARKRHPQPVEFYARLAQNIARWVRKAKFKLAIAKAPRGQNIPDHHGATAGWGYTA